MRVQGKVAVVTGAASGIGRASAVRLAAEGARVVVADLDPAQGEAVARETGGLFVPTDVSDEAQVERLFARAVETFGQLDIVLNNAGIAVRNRATEQDVAGWDRVMAVNLRGVFLGCKQAIPHLQERGGSIINMSSAAGITGIRNRAAYATSKGAIVTLTKNLALDYARWGVRVNCICPGFTDTPLLTALKRDAARWQRLVETHPLGRLGTAEDIANAVLFLASDEASFVTGHALVVDGGFSAGRAEDL